MVQFLVSPLEWHDHVVAYLHQLQSNFKRQHPACLVDFGSAAELTYHLIDTHCWRPRREHPRKRKVELVISSNSVWKQTNLTLWYGVYYGIIINTSLALAFARPWTQHFNESSGVRSRYTCGNPVQPGIHRNPSPDVAVFAGCHEFRE